MCALTVSLPEESEVTDPPRPQSPGSQPDDTDSAAVTVTLGPNQSAPPAERELPCQVGKFRSAPRRMWVSNSGPQKWSVYIWVKDIIPALSIGVGMQAQCPAGCRVNAQIRLGEKWLLLSGLFHRQYLVQRDIIS